jgi:hypothetical protein
MGELSSKHFLIPKAAPIPLDQIKEWFDSIDCGSDDFLDWESDLNEGVVDPIIEKSMAAKGWTWRRG